MRRRRKKTIGIAGMSVPCCARKKKGLISRGKNALFLEIRNQVRQLGRCFGKIKATY